MLQGDKSDFLQLLDKYLETGDNLEEEDRLVEGVYNYFTETKLKKFKGMEFDTERQIMMSKRSAELIRLL